MLTATGSSFISGAQIVWDGSALPTTYVTSTQLTAQVPAANLGSVRSVQVAVMNPSPAAQPSGNLPFYIGSGGTNIAVLNVNANAIAWDARRSRIYASLPSTNNGSNGNTVAVIDPVAATVLSYHPAGHFPDLMSISSDASYLLVGEDADSAVQRFKLPDFTPDITIPIAPSPTFGPLNAVGLAASPDDPHAAAIVSGSFEIEPVDVGGLSIYDDAIQRPKQGSPDWQPGNPIPLDWIQWGATSSSLYGGNSFIPPQFYTTPIDAAGVETSKLYEYVLDGGGHFDSQTGYVYGDNGQVVDPETGESVGSFSLLHFAGSTICAVDSAQGVVFFVGGLRNGNKGIEAFDQKTYQLLRTLTLPQINGEINGFLRWGNAGLAVLENPLSYQTFTPIPGSIYLVDGDFVNSSAAADFKKGEVADPLPSLHGISPQSAVAGSADLSLTVTGANFEPNVQVYWNLNSLQVQYLSPTELQATVPASHLASPGPVNITVSNGDSTAPGMNLLVFTVLTPNSGLTPMNLLAHDVAWDKTSGLLYAAVWSGDWQYANSIVAIDPKTGSVVKTQPAGPDPDLIRTTADGAYAYEGSLTADTVTRFNLPGLDSPVTWRLGVSQPASTGDPMSSLYAVDLQPAPNAPQTTAVSTPGGIEIFDNATARPTQASDFTPARTYYYSSLQWSGDGSKLYSAGSDLYVLDVTPSGVTQSVKYFGLVNDPSLFYDSGTGYLYNNSGQAIDPSNGTIVGTYASSGLRVVGYGRSLTGLLVPDSSLNTVFILGQTLGENESDYTITSYNQKTFAPISSIVIHSILCTPVKLIRWGASGLALVTYSTSEDETQLTPGMVYILNLPNFVTKNASATGGNAPEEVH